MPAPLPEIRTPSTLPPWRASPHNQQLLDAYASVRFARGSVRRRRVVTTAPIELECGLELSASEAADFFNWYEIDLAVGSRQFATLVQGLNPNLEWWTAQFVEVYKGEPLTGGDWNITAKLRLSGIGYTAIPEIAPFQTTVSIPLLGSAKPTVVTIFETTRVDIALSGSVVAGESVAFVSPTISLALDGSVAIAIEMREDGGYELREDGGYELGE